MSEREFWWIANPDGSVTYHTENDGYAFMRRGAEPEDVIMTLDEALQGNRGVPAIKVKELELLLQEFDELGFTQYRSLEKVKGKMYGANEVER